uniref:Uncharacterized protein n=1 Tax=Hucho hucho TaxID=62062 RepID=A0A4W5Q4H0_9TELE
MSVSRVSVGDTSKKGISVFDIQILPEDRGQKFGQMEEEASEQMRPLLTSGNDDEAVVDLGKTSSTIHTNFEKEELESKSDFSVYIYTQSITWARILFMLTVYTEYTQSSI